MTQTGAPRSRARVVELGLGAAWLLAVAAVLLVIERLLPSAALAAPIFGALVADVAAGRAGVRWEDAPPSGRSPVRRIAGGAGAAMAAGLVVVVVAIPLGLLQRHGAGVHPDPALLLAVVRSASVAVRDELLYRGIPLFFAARAGVHPLLARGFAALAGGAAIVLLPGVGPAAVALAVVSGWFFATLWQRDRGAWAALGAHATWLLFFGSVLHGGLFDVDWTRGNLAIGATSWGAPAWLATAVLAAASWWLGRSSNPER